MKTKLTKEQKDFLNLNTIGTWKINSKTGLIDIKGNFCLFYLDEGIKNFNGIKFGVVTGDFTCSDNKITSLVGAPQKVGGDFSCSDNKLTSLVGAPQKVGGDFFCHNNKLTSLEGAPKEVGGYFICSSNPVREDLLNMIWEKMQNGTTYHIALSSLKKVFKQKREKEIQEIISSYDPIIPN